jgi:hypothetical protein
VLAAAGAAGVFVSEVLAAAFLAAALARRRITDRATAAGDFSK